MKIRDDQAAGAYLFIPTVAGDPIEKALPISPYPSPERLGMVS
jgi:hypothetical protein